MHRFYAAVRGDSAAKSVTNCLILAGVAGHGYFGDMHRTIQSLTLEAAENIAVQGLVFLAAEPARLARFLTLTGLAACEVREQAGTAAIPRRSARASFGRRIAVAVVCCQRIDRRLERWRRHLRCCNRPRTGLDGDERCRTRPCGVAAWHRSRRQQDRRRGPGPGRRRCSRSIACRRRGSTMRRQFARSARWWPHWSKRRAAAARIGIGMPGSISPASGLVQNANSTWLNGRPFAGDLEAHLGRAVRLANDANCFALSEAIDGAGCRSRLRVRRHSRHRLRRRPRVRRRIDRRAASHRRRVGAQSSALGEPGRASWAPCAGAAATAAWKRGCRGQDWRPITHARAASALASEKIAERADAGDAQARASLDRHASRLARGLAHVVNIFDPHVIVLGGGLSQAGASLPA